MRFRFLAIAVVCLAACVSPKDSGVTVIVGAKLDPGTGPVIDYSVVVIADGKFQAVGPQASTPVPKGAEIVSGSGMKIERVNGSPIERGKAANLILTGTTARVMQDGKWIPTGTP